MPNNTKEVAVLLLREEGFPAIARMLEIFDKPTQVDQALDLKNNAHNWFAMRSLPSRAAEKLAEYWLQQQDQQKDVQEPSYEESEAPVQASLNNTFLVMCPPESKGTLERILKMLHCNFEALA